MALQSVGAGVKWQSNVVVLPVFVVLVVVILVVLVVVVLVVLLVVVLVVLLVDEVEALTNGLQRSLKGTKVLWHPGFGSCGVG
jgi:hypothetical protein